MANPPDPNPRCKICAHWQQANRMEAGARAEVGECHARPPTTNYAWPRTLADQVCGEYRPIDAPRVVAARPREGNKRITAPQNQLGSLLSNETIS